MNCLQQRSHRRMAAGIPARMAKQFRCGSVRRLLPTALIVLVAGMTQPDSTSAAEPAAPAPVNSREAGEQFFEKSVRPLLIRHCLECHDDVTASGSLRIDARAHLLKGGESGPAIVPGSPEKSRLIQAVRRQGDLEMPPETTLAARDIETLEHWIRLGAPWPDTPPLTADETQDKAASHWAFQPVRDVEPPAAADSGWGRNSIDRFVAARLKQHGLAPSREADRRTLIRRASYTLTGLPPTAAEVAEFIADARPDAYERLIDRLLASPQYGEQWARHWLDVARYSDTKGYVYAREERFWTHAWVYRDWVVEALNRDLPYDRFLLLQIAGDQVEDRSEDDLAAMGFLTLGRRFLGVDRDIIDDRIDVVCRGTMALTVGCARCHNHKYDPIPTADYYSLYGVFASSAERLVDLRGDSPGSGEFQAELTKRQDALAAKMASSRATAAQRVRERIADYLKAQTEIEKYPPAGFDQILQASDLLPDVVHHWANFLRRMERRNDPVFRHWHAYRALPAEEFESRAAEMTEQLQKPTDPPANRRIAAAFTDPPASFDEVIERYAEVMKAVDAEWIAVRRAAQKAGESEPEELEDADAEAIRRVLYSADGPCVVPDLPIVHSEIFFDSPTRTELWKLQGKVDRWIIDGDATARFALTMVDRRHPVTPHVFRRGDPENPGPEVPRRFLSVIAGEDRQPFEQGSGRLEMARAIIAPHNPLTARVMVNRVWAHHFGQGLVTTPSDFGLRAQPPSHPDLLDWLAGRFVEEGWSLKSLHRMILLSATFRQSSRGPADDDQRSLALRRDPANRLLWRMNARRLTFEEFRDSLFAACGTLDRTIGGKPVKLFSQPPKKRRTLYGLVDRQYLPGTLRMFDFANPDLHVAERSETTVPQQALFFMNHALVVDRARRLARLTESDDTAESRIRQLFQRTYQRDPTPQELGDALAFIATAAPEPTPDGSLTRGDWLYGYGAVDEQSESVTGFRKLPHFTGTAWQGGENWPDSKLGWVQLTATGGHPGNTRSHASVRRWVAPRAMTVSINSKLVHEAAPGDGIRGWIISSRGGRLQSAVIHQETAEMNVAKLQVAAGETLDFVVDIGDVLNSDQYLWAVKIAAIGDDSDTVWDSQADFTPQSAGQLSPWQQLAHVLLCGNEFMFVD